MRPNGSISTILSLAVFFVVQPVVRAVEGPTPDMNQAEAVAKIQDKLKEINDSLVKAFKGVDKDIKKLYEDNTSLSLKLLNAQDRIEKLEKSFGQLQIALKPGPNGATDLPPNKGVIDERVDITSKNSDLINRLFRLETQVDQLRRDVDDLKKRVGSTSFYPPEKSLDDIKLRLEQMERDISGLKSGSRVAFSPPAVTGRLALVNRTNEEMLFLVNGNSYRVNPLATKIIEGFPAGAVTYEVVSSLRGSAGQRLTNLPANYTLTLTAE